MIITIDRNGLLKGTAIVGTAVFVLCMGLILYLGFNKTIEIENVAQDSVMGDVASSAEGDTDSIIFKDSPEYTEYLCIPLKNKVEAGDIVIENHYMDSELVIHIDGMKSDFYRENALVGNRRNILDGTVNDAHGGIVFNFKMDGIYEYKTVLENNNLYISFLNPRELYDRIVVIDPCCGGADTGLIANGLNEKDINLDVARKLKDIMDASGENIKAYYTRMDDVNPSDEKRVRLANETKADMYIVIRADLSDDESLYGVSAVYNDDYFIPGFGSIELADVMLSNVTTDVKGKALGLLKAPAQDYTIRHATVPAAIINVGLLSNKQEAILLGRDDYRMKIATGIYNGILGAYERIG